MRSKFDRALEKLHTQLVEMGEMCEDLINNAAKALLENDQELAHMVINNEQEIDNEEREIETLCLKLLLTQQPVARDLRQISAALKMITDMERIGDQAEDIAEIVTQMDVDDTLKQLPLYQMSEATKWMVTKSIDAYVKKDSALAENVIKYDDVVDDLFSQIKGALITYITDTSNMDNKDHGQYALDLLMVAKYYERIGDHAVNIAEWVLFSITGEHVH